MSKIAIFASGSGTNAEAIMNYVERDLACGVEVALVVSNNGGAFVLERAAKHGVPTLHLDKTLWRERPQTVLEKLSEKGIDFIVLAGFMLLVPPCIIEAYSGRIVNVHPALLPAYGGKGMYGDRVHRAVIENGERESGITIHFVDEHYDQGAVILQVKCKVDQQDTPQTLAQKIHQLEHQYFPKTIVDTLKSKQSQNQQ